MDNLQPLLDQTHAYLQESVAPQANEMDSDPEVLYTALRGLGGRALLALRVPKAWGGTEASAETFWTFQEMVARYSGALAFVQTQHQSAAAMLAQSDNELLKQEYLPPMNQGKTLVGIAFSQLRRQGDPLVKALPVAGGYQLDGKLPWVTGFRFFQS
ncbi:MAG TPA: acyl-CoA dehydrogenase family protein, partial [Candidatus Caenarcaniphilales bacterium]